MVGLKQDQIHLTDILTRILTIVEYKNDREIYIRNFIDKIYRNSILESIALLDKDKKEQALSILSNASEPINTDVFLERNLISQDNISEQLNGSATRLLDEFMKAMLPTLNDYKKNELKTYLDSISNQTIIVRYKE